MASHIFLLAVIVFHRAKPIDITPTWLAWGNSAHSYKITYLAPSDEPADETKLSLPPSAAKKSRPRPPAESKKPTASKSIINSMPTRTQEPRIPRQDLR